MKMKPSGPHLTISNFNDFLLVVTTFQEINFLKFAGASLTHFRIYGFTKKYQFDGNVIFLH